MKRTDLALAALASAAVPGMKPVAVARLSVETGAESELQQAVVEDATGRRWLVRSPLTAIAGARLQRNDELVRQLARHLPFKVPAAAGYAAVGTEGHAAVYPHVEGATLDFTRLPAGAGLAHAVGRAIAAIHNIPAAVFEQQDVPSFDAAGCRQRLIAEVDRAAETGRVPTRLLARWEEAFDAAALWQFAGTPVHGSFRGATVVVAFADQEADSGRVVAITDWDEAMVGDPAADFADLYAQASPQTWESVLDSYALTRAQRPDPYLHARARLLSETSRVRGLALHVSAGEEESARRIVEALRRMDRLTEDEDSLVPATARGAAASSAATVSPVAPAAAGADPQPAETDDIDDTLDTDESEAHSSPADEPATGPSWETSADAPVDDGDRWGTDADTSTDDLDDGDRWGTDADTSTDDLDDKDDLDDGDDLDDVQEPPAAADPFLDDGDPDPHPDDATDRGDGDEAVHVPHAADPDITADIPVVTPAVQESSAPTQADETGEPEEGTAEPGEGTTEPQEGTAEPGQSSMAAPTDTDLLDDDTRLHELYGMPPADDPRT